MAGSIRFIDKYQAITEVIQIEWLLKLSAVFNTSSRACLVSASPMTIWSRDSAQEADLSPLLHNRPDTARDSHKVRRQRNITHRSGVATQIKTPVLGNIQRPEQLLCKRSKSITSQIVATGGGRSNPTLISP